MAGVQAEAILDAVGGRLSLILPTVVALTAVVLLQHYVLRRGSLANLPLVGQELGGDEKRRQLYLTKSRDLYLEGYKKVGSTKHGPPARTRSVRLTSWAVQG